MSPLTLYLAKLLGAYSLFAGAWLMSNKEKALAFIDRVVGDSVFETVIGLLRMTLGLAIVIGHDRWGGWLEIAVSLIGWIALLNGLWALFAPAGTLAKIVAWLRFRENVGAWGLVSFALGAVLLTGGFIG
jgi:hypothetical protein